MVVLLFATDVCAGAPRFAPLDGILSRCSLELPGRVSVEYGDSRVGRAWSDLAKVQSSERTGPVMSHITVRIEVTLESFSAGTAMKHGYSECEFLFGGTPSGGASKTRQTW